MSTTYLFTTKELQGLIAKSKAMADLSPELRAEVSALADSPQSGPAQTLYGILINEREQYNTIQKEYIQESGKIVAEFQIEITAAYTEKLRQEQRTAEHKIKKAEANVTSQLLNTFIKK